MKHPVSLVLLGFGLIIITVFHIGLMFDFLPFEQKHILYCNLAIILLLRPAFSILHKSGQEVVIEQPFKTAIKVFPFWLKAWLIVILFYSAIAFINFTYVQKPLADKPDIDKVLIKMNKGVSAATMFFYAAMFGLVNLNVRVKKAIENDSRNAGSVDERSGNA